MPFYLKELDVDPQVKKFNSVLIVSCGFCPAASMALRRNEPYLQFFRRFMNTACFEEYIKELKRDLEETVLKTCTFRGNIFRSPFNFIICMWNSRQWEKFTEQLSKYEAAVVLGCEAAYENVRNAAKLTGCRVFPGMETEGVFSIIPNYQWPDTIRLELRNVTPVTCHV